MAEQYGVGDLVDITICGARIVDDYGSEIEYQTRDGAKEWRGYINLVDPHITITRVTPPVPASWPPHVGDTWLDETGMAWFAFESASSIARRGGLAMAPAVTPDDATSLPTPEQLLAAHPGLTLANRVSDDDALAGLIAVGHHPRHPNGASTVETS